MRRCSDIYFLKIPANPSYCWKAKTQGRGNNSFYFLNSSILGSCEEFIILFLLGILQLI